MVRRETHETIESASPALDVHTPIREAEDLPIFSFRLLSEAFASQSSKSFVVQVGRAIAEFGVASISLDGASFTGVVPEVAAAILGSPALAEASLLIFSQHELLHQHYREVPNHGAEDGFYSFHLNHMGGDVRSNAVDGIHKGLPRSLIWNHDRSSPVIQEIEGAQSLLASAERLTEEVANLVVEALVVYFDDRAGLLRELVGAPHRANHLKTILSPGATSSDALVVDSSTSLVCRHRAHVDHSVLTIYPASLPQIGEAGRFYYLAKSGGRRCWRPLVAQPNHFVVFGGVDLETFTGGTSFEIAGLPHQVLATRDEALRNRHSALFRMVVNPDARTLCTLDGRSFSFHGTETPTGKEYYQALAAHRKGY